MKERNMSSLYQIYMEMHEDKLSQITVNEAKDLTPEARGELLNALIDRGCDEKVIRNIQNQLKVFSDDEIAELGQRYTKGICPICNEERPVNGMSVTTTKGYYLFGETKVSFHIGCEYCLDEVYRKALITNLTRGWLSGAEALLIPFTVIGQAIKYNRLKRSFNSISKDYSAYIKNNIGLVLNTIDLRE
jgi:hypothetical protein